MKARGSKQSHADDVAADLAPQTGGKGSTVQARYGVGGPAVQRKPAADGAVQLQDEEGHDHGHEHEEPDPGGGGDGDLDTTRPVGDNIPEDIKNQLMSELRRSPRMEQVLQEIADNGGASFDIKWSARGNFHRSGAIHLDRRRDMDRWIPSMMHELNHLNDHRQGRRPSSRGGTREEFVNTKMTNEIRAHAIGYVALLEHEGSDSEVATSAPAGYADFKAYLRQRENDESVCFSSSAIQAMAETWLEDKYRNEWTTSNTGENYYDYWGRVWDEANPGG